MLRRYPRAVRGLNFNHLHYFWAVARHGSVRAAARDLLVSEASISTQIRSLEHRLGGPLFIRTGRAMQLTGLGETTARFADEMFRLGGELLRVVEGGDASSDRPLRIGTSDGVPKLVARRLVAACIGAVPGLRVVCREWRTDQLVQELAVQRLDLVLSDAPWPTSGGAAVHSRLLAESELAWFAPPSIARRLKRGFPDSLADAEVVLPTENTAVRSAIDTWCERRGVAPKIVVEAEDRALLHYLAQSGLGAVPVAVAFATEIARQFDLVRIGAMRGVRDQYHILTTRGAGTHPLLRRCLRALFDEFPQRTK
jgi:LysR family transcriptional activator of nhaA